MPIYEYVCSACGHAFEQLQKVSDPAPEACPACAQGPVNRKLSAAAFRLKGGGWYETDFKTAGKRNVLEDSSASTESTKTDGDKTKAAPAAGAETKAAEAPKPAAPASGSKDAS